MKNLFRTLASRGFLICAVALFAYWMLAATQSHLTINLPLLATLASLAVVGSVVATKDSDCETWRQEQLIGIEQALISDPVDLTVRCDTLEGHESEPCLRSINQVMQHWCDDIAWVDHQVAGLSHCSVELASNANQIYSETVLISEELTSVAAASEELNTNMASIAASAEQMSMNTKTLASAAEEMTVSIADVARSSEKSAADADLAAKQATEANETMRELGEAAQGIGKVVDAIKDIAEQTKLLALNATIEAARAGEAGRGFSVVATEVKELARQSAEASEDIRKRIEYVQSQANGAEQAVGGISQAVSSLSLASQSIASAIEQQRVTTQEIAKNVTENAAAADSVARQVSESASVCGMIAKSATQIDSAVKKAAIGAGHSQEASEQLTHITDAMVEFVEGRQTNHDRFDPMPIKAAHGKWRVKLAEMISGRKQLDPRDLSDHTECQFGKWYYQEGRQQFGHLPSFAKIEQQHADVHAMAREIVDLFHRGERREAAVQLSDFPALTQALFDSLDQLEIEAH